MSADDFNRPKVGLPKTLENAERERKPSLEWNEELQTFLVLPGMCPYPIGKDDGTAAMCIENDNCGCEIKSRGRYPRTET
jgi:hypothetical protein